MWPDNRLLDLIGTQLPIVQAPMAGASGPAMALAVCEAGGLGSLPCAMLSSEKAYADISALRLGNTKPFNVNFFCHEAVANDAAKEAAWKQELIEYYVEHGLDTDIQSNSINRAPFDEAMCEIIEELKPPVVSFHFGLPVQPLLHRVKSIGCTVLSSATTVQEARWLESHGCDVIIAQGYEAGGHRGMFLTDEINTQPGTLALVPQVVDAVNVPVIAAGGISDGRAIAAAFALGASGVQIGTAYLFTPESLISDLHRAELHRAQDDLTALTNLFTGRPARGLLNKIMGAKGPMSNKTPPFPTAGANLAPLKAAAEKIGSVDFSSLWAGQSAALCKEMGAAELTRTLAANARQRLLELGTAG